MYSEEVAQEIEQLYPGIVVPRNSIENAQFEHEMSLCPRNLTKKPSLGVKFETKVNPSLFITSCHQAASMYHVKGLPTSCYESTGGQPKSEEERALQTFKSLFKQTEFNYELRQLKQVYNEEEQSVSLKYSSFYFEFMIHSLLKDPFMIGDFWIPANEEHVIMQEFIMTELTFTDQQNFWVGANSAE
jgi:hypothetical protein